MATNYPGSIDSLTNPSAGDALTSPSHSAQHANANDAIEAIETELGVNPSGSDATVAARLTAIEAGTNLATGAVTSAKIADGTIVNDDINASAAIARSKISGLPTSSTDNTVARFDSTAGAIQTSGVVIDDNNRLTVATGATGGYGFASGAVHLSGTGSPEGVVTAAPGSSFLQIGDAVTVSGNLLWRKATGTGNTGWVPEGALADTGWRNVAALLDADFSVADGGTVYLRRVGGHVYLSVRGVDRVTASGDRGDYSASNMLPLPTGFTLGTYTPIGAAQVAGLPGWLSGGGTLNTIAAYCVAATHGTWADGDAVWGEGNFLTTDGWPSSLPGSAA